MKYLFAILLIALANPAWALRQKHHHHPVERSPIAMTTQPIAERINRFAAMMAEKHQFNQQEVHDFLMNVEPDDRVFKFFSRRAKKNFTPEELEELKKLAEQRVANGIEFWNEHEAALNKAEKLYGVPPEIIVGLIGIETSYGSYLGRFKAHQTLVTLAFYGKHRPAYFAMELENFLVLAREYAWDRTNIPCSYAGAVGIPQFMPDNMQPYAVDFNGDGQIDLMDPDDAIGSVANFLSQHGWVRGEAVATRTNARVARKTFVLRTLPGPAPTIWRKQENFHVIRQYNPLDSYAMSIFILAQKMKEIKSKQVPLQIDPLQIEIPPVESEDQPSKPSETQPEPRTPESEIF